MFVFFFDESAGLFHSTHASHHSREFFLFQLTRSQTLIAQLDLKFIVAAEALGLELASENCHLDRTPGFVFVPAVYKPALFRKILDVRESRRSLSYR